jgi:AcrR family transcriptional regulator
MSKETPIREAALRLFVNEGLANVSMRRIAKEVGVTATALYRHYDGKEAILSELLREGFRTFFHYERQAMYGQDAWERMRLLGQGYVRFGLDNPAYYELMFMTAPIAEVPLNEEQTHQQAEATFQFLVDRVADLQQAGYLAKALDLHEVASAIWGLSHGLVSLYLKGYYQLPAADFEALFQRSHSHLLRGMHPEAYARSSAGQAFEDRNP